MPPRHSLITAALFAVSLVILGLAGCGQAPHDDPQVFWDQTPAQAPIAATLHARDLPGGGGKVYHVAPTGSMRPLIDDGDYIVVDTKLEFGSLTAGRPVVYQAEWRTPTADPVTHRLSQKDGYGWIASGDAVRPVIDENGRNVHSEARYRITAANYRGVVVGVYTTRRKP